MNLLDEIKQTFSRSNNIITRIIIANIAVFIAFALIQVFAFLFQLDSSSVSVFKKWLMLPASFSTFIAQPWAIITYMFLHEGFLHLLFNMLWLFWIGRLLHEYLGNKRVAETYFAGAVFGGGVYMVCFNVFPVFSEMVSVSYALGASAGVLSIIIATATLLPNYPINLLLFGAVRLKYLAVISVVVDLIGIPAGNAGGHIAHLGGALFGFLYIRYIYKWGSLIPDSWTQLFSKNPKMKIHHRTKSINSDTENKPSQEEIDLILDKISKSGYDSLSKREKDILFKASKD